MKALDLPRRGGKTWTAVQHMLRNPEMVMVCPTYVQAKKAYEMASAVNPSINRHRFLPVSALPLQGFPEDTRLIFDEADNILHTLAGAPVSLITFTSTTTDKEA